MSENRSPRSYDGGENHISENMINEMNNIQRVATEHDEED
jgi:hypothetical protein